MRELFLLQTPRARKQLEPTPNQIKILPCFKMSNCMFIFKILNSVVGLVKFTHIVAHLHMSYFIYILLTLFLHVKVSKQ